MNIHELFGDNINKQAAIDALRHVAWEYHMQEHEVLYICLSNDSLRIADAMRDDVKAAYKSQCRKYR